MHYYIKLIYFFVRLFQHDFLIKNKIKTVFYVKLLYIYIDYIRCDMLMM